MRALKILVIVMGVLIVAGTATLIVLIARRASGPMAARSVGPIERVLDEPAGTRITTITATADRLALHLQGGGPDRVLIIDPTTGLITARIALAP